MTNLKTIKRSNKYQAGDIFAMQLLDNKYIFGRIIAYPAEPSPWPKASLIYIYNFVSSDREPALNKLTPDNLLIPPQFTNQMLWTKGYAIQVAHHPVRDDDILENYCFLRNDSYGKPEYVNEKRERIHKRVQPCGIWGMTNHQGIDDRVSDALGIKRSPIAEKDLYYPVGGALRKFSDTELRKYSNYEEIVKKYPEVIEQ